MVANWNAVISPDDEVFHHGDFSLSMRAMEHVVPRLHGRITLLAGNHDLCWYGGSNRTKARNALTRYARLFHRVVPEGIMRHTICGHDVLLSHLPYYGDSKRDERYSEQRPRDEGLPLICAHVHTAWRRQHGDLGRVHRNQINVGVDVWNYYPVPEENLAVLLDTLPAGQASPRLVSPPATDTPGPGE